MTVLTKDPGTDLPTEKKVPPPPPRDEHRREQRTPRQNSGTRSTWTKSERRLRRKRAKIARREDR